MFLDFLSAEEAEEKAYDWPDVYFAPGYGRAAAEMDDGIWELAIGNGGQFLYPYIKRAIKGSRAEAPRYDIASPYGYAGVWATKETQDQDWIEFRQRFRELSRERGCVAEFLRLGSIIPGREQLVASDSAVRAAPFNSTISVDLRGGYDAYWKNSEGRSRTAIRKAKRLGYEARVRRAGADDLCAGSAFRRLYESTMDRLAASRRYYFSDRYYVSLLTALGERLLIGEAYDVAKSTVSAALFMRWKGVLHYHLAGSNPGAARDGANNLLIDTAIEWGIERGYDSLHLGGGISDDDGLFRFKAGFGGSRLEFWLGRAVFNQSEYERLTHLRALELSLPVEKLLASSFFPAYRSP